METKLTFLLNHRVWLKLLFKNILFALFFYLAWRAGFSWGSFFLLFFVLLVIYFFGFPDRSAKFSFWFAPFFGALILKFVFSFGSLLSWIIFFVTLVAFFLILGIGNLIFRERFLVYDVANTVIFFLSFLFYYSFNNLLPASLILFFIVVLVFSETLRFFGFAGFYRRFLISVAAGLLILEIGWFISFLPLGFINAAALLTFLAVLIRDSVAVHLNGFLNKSFILRELAFFVFLMIIIFSFSRWNV